MGGRPEVSMDIRELLVSRDHTTISRGSTSPARETQGFVVQTAEPCNARRGKHVQAHLFTCNPLPPAVDLAHAFISMPNVIQAATPTLHYSETTQCPVQFPPLP